MDTAYAESSAGGVESTAEATAGDTAGHRCPASDGPRRAKRARYTAVACNECKKRKLKCVPVDDGSCQRCINEASACVYAQVSKHAAKAKNDRGINVQTLQHDVQQLQKKVSELESNAALVKNLQDCIRMERRWHPSPSSGGGESFVGQSPASSQREGVPKEPQFVGPTRSAFGIIIGERSLTGMGIPTFEPAPPSGAQSPVRSFSTGEHYWQTVTAEEIARLLTVFQEEVESVYPILDIGEQVARADQILQAIRHGRLLSSGVAHDVKDVEIVVVAVATAIVLETHGKRGELSGMIVQPVESSLAIITRPKVNLKEIQLIAILSIYYFHCGDELLAWRTIGIAAREALEMGLHRKKSLLDNFGDSGERRLATRVFWCVYVLDRRWSFGTSLSFALVDRDIDPELPEPDSEYAYLRCMVAYGRLSSKLWEAIPPFGSQSQFIPEDAVHDLDSSTKEWLQMIPPDLQLRHPRLGLAPRSQPRVIHRLRALLYLRGNHTRTLIYRHHLLSAQSIAANPRSARLVVDIAQDSIQVLVHLNSTSDIYSRQQSAFNYFLLSSLSIIFLAVCHAPDIFSEPCRKGFTDAAELVRGFSRHSVVSRRLWNSIRGLLPRIKSLCGSQSSYGGSTAAEASDSSPPLASHSASHSSVNGHHAGARANGISPSVSQPDSNIDPGLGMEDIPSMFEMSNELLSLFDAFGQGQILHETGSQIYGPDGEVLGGFGDETVRPFQSLI